MTTLHYSNVVVYSELGGGLRTARRTRVFISDPATGLPVDVTQGGVTAPYVDSDATGRVDFTAEDKPWPLRWTNGAVFMDVYPLEAPGLMRDSVAAAEAAQLAAEEAAIGATAPTDTVVAGLVPDTGSATGAALAGMYAPLGVTAASLGWRIATDPVWNPGGTGDLTVAIQAAHDDIVASGGMGVVYVPPGEWTISSTITLDVRHVILSGYNSSLTFTPTSGVMIQVEGSTTGLAAQVGPMLAGVRLYGPGKATSTTAIKMNTDDALVTLSYVAAHPLRDIRVAGFGVGILWARRSWGNVLHSSHLEGCGVAYKVPTGMDASMGERIGAIDTIFADNDLAVEIASGSVDAHFTHCSFDYNAVMMKSSRETFFTDCHIETNGAAWTGAVGHVQHTADTASTVFTSCAFVFSAITSEPFEPLNTGALADIYGRTDTLSFVNTKWTVTWGTFVSRFSGFPHRRLVNEISGNRNLRRGKFVDIKVVGNPGPIFGASLVAGRSMAGAAIPAATQTVAPGAASTVSSTLDDMAGVPLSSITITVGASHAGVSTQNVKIQVPVGPQDYGKRLFVAQRADLTVTGADSQRTVYARAFTRGDVEIGTFEAWAGMTAIPTGTTTGVDLFPSTGWAYSTVPAGAAYISIEVQITKIRTGDSYKLYAPLVNIA